MTSAKILLVEDDEDDYVLTRDYLEELSFLQVDVQRASNGSQALEMLTREEFDLCLLDYQLGTSTGLDVLREAHTLGCSAPIIMLTGQTDRTLDESALNAGAADYLVKSEISTNRFERAIRYALARREVEAERVERLKAEAENRAKNRFLAHLSHELRTPLTAILGYTEILLADPAAQKSREELEIILRNGRHLLDLLNDLLDLSKIVANKLELNFALTDIGVLLADVQTLMTFAAVDKGLSLELRCTTAIPSKILTDAKRLRQILINLISNAIKFTDKGGVCICVSTTQTEDVEYLVIDVHDTGIGIAKDHYEAIFKPFTQVADTFSKSLDGSGLGLAISSELAQRLGGDLTVESQFGEGSCFRLRIHPGDVRQAEREVLRFNLCHLNTENVPIPQLRGRLLIVDDLRDIRRLIGHIAERWGLDAVSAANGQEALQLLERSYHAGEPFDLVLMDIHMPEMNGEDAVKEIRQRGWKVPVVALTAVSMQGSVTKLLALGFDDLLSKPVDVERLGAVLQAYLPSPNNESAKALSILLVDDDHDTASALAGLLKGLGAEATVCHSLAEASQELTGQHWSALLIDYHLPDGNGLDFVRRYSTPRPWDHAIIVTGEQCAQPALKAAGIDQALLKPIQMSDLAALLENISHSQKTGL